MRRCRDEDRAANPAEQAALARWAGWGLFPQVFDDTYDLVPAERAQIRQLLGTEEAWSQARRTTLNAHYTSASVVTAMWSAVRDLGVDGPVRVLEPVCGSGNFLGFAPLDAVLTGVELDPTTAVIARHLYGARATIHTGAFEDLRVEGFAMGFKYVASGPLVRSSYKAAEAFLRGQLTKTTGPAETPAARPHRSLPVLP